MPLTLILGPANSAKAGEVLAAYTAAARRDALLVVPTMADAAHYDRELAADGVLLGRAITFAGLIAEIARRAGYGEARLSSRQRERVLRRAIASVPLDRLRGSALTPGFAGAAGALFAELIRRRIASGRFAAAAARAASKPDTAAPHARELAALYDAYVRTLTRIGRPDADQFASRALDALALRPAGWGRTPIYFYGFDDLTPTERDVIETLARPVGAQVTVSLTFEPGREAFAARSTIAQELGAIATTVRQLPRVAEHYTQAAREPLHHLERFLFEPSPPRIDPADAVRLLEAGGALAEAELIAAEALDACRAGVPADQIVVVCRSLERSGALLERVMARYGLAVTCERPIKVAHTAIGRALLGLARCALLEPSVASAEDLFAYLRAPGVLPLARLDEVDAIARQQALRTAEQVRAAAGLRLGEIDSLRAAGDPASELARQTRRLLAAPHQKLGACLDTVWEREARAAGAVLEALNELGELEDRPAREELLELLGELRVKPPPASISDAVLIAEPLSIRARRFRVVILSGLCVGEFPLTSAPDPLLDDAGRRELSLAGSLALGGGEDPLARERYLLYTSASRATERLVLSYRSCDEEGAAISPSPFLDDVADLFAPEWRQHPTRRLLADVVWEEHRAPTELERRYARAAAAAAVAAAARQNGTSAATPETRVLAAATLRHVRHVEVVSGNALERFAACPVSWLVERQLEPRELTPESDPLARGNLMHDLLEQLIGELGGPVTPASLDRALALLDGLAAGLSAQLGSGRPPSVSAAIRDGILADLRRYLRAEADDGCDWIPQRLEWGFGIDGEQPGPPAAVLSDGERTTQLRGMIDRIDVAPDGRRAIVRDYKSGANRASRAAARWLADHELQVGLYMIVARRLLNLEPVAGLYHPLSGKDLRPRGAHLKGTGVSECTYSTDALDGEALDELLERVERDAVAIASAIGRGELTPCPARCSRDGCRHPAICWAG